MWVFGWDEELHSAWRASSDQDLYLIILETLTATLLNEFAMPPFHPAPPPPTVFFIPILRNDPDAEVNSIRIMSSYAER